MKEFIRKNSELIVKLVVHQIGLTVFGFLLNSCASVSGNENLGIIFGLFSAAFYWFLIYILLWEIGTKDKIRIEAGRMKKDVFKGAKVALVAAIPNLVLTLISTVGYLAIDRSVMVDGKFTSPEWAANLYSIAQIIGIFINSMYTGIGEYFGITVMPYFLFLATLPAILVTGLGYYLGTKEKFGIFTGAR
ncbi:MAG: hypothetical protein E7634_01140 [Ruminococcaceae bacterium]|nr:hypothetical protein [Oscillospiraceae bacterium]